jgi:PTH1 family peptidyl-tRNA hydrolase
MDVLTDKQNIKLDKLKFHALLALGEMGGVCCVFIKPNTYMNNSGLAVSECAKFYQIPPERILVLCDDVSFPPGIMRIRRGGSAGGQNGVKSIIDHLGTQAFPRIKLGVGQKPHPDYDLADWVLSSLSPTDQKSLRTVCNDVCAAAELIVSGQMDEAMSRYSH